MPKPGHSYQGARFPRKEIALSCPSTTQLLDRMPLETKLPSIEFPLDK